MMWVHWRDWVVSLIIGKVSRTWREDVGGVIVGSMGEDDAGERKRVAMIEHLTQSS